jgi:hypothetical protein
MDVTLLRSWLDLPPGPWPPDHYALLGLPPGRSDPAAVEPRVLERMELLRRRQLQHPDLVTEGMNRLAQALIVLTDQSEKAAYDAGHGFSPAPPADAVRPPDAGPPDPAVVAEPETIPFADEPELPPRLVPLGLLPEEHAVPVPTADAFEIPDPVTAVVPVAEPAAPPGPAARRWIYARLALLRKATRAWDRLGPVLGDPQDRVDRPGRVLILLDAVRAVRPLLPDLRGVVGGVGEPGGVVAAVVRQPLLLDTFRRLLPGQRQAVAIDWRRGQAELQREYARFRALARRGRDERAGTRGRTALWRWLNDTPEAVLVLLAAAAFGIALLRGGGGR